MNLTQKIVLILLSFVTIFQCKKESEQRVKISDDNFLKALIKQGIDRNGNGIISQSEAEMVTFLDVGSNSISDLTGIEAFINLDTLRCQYNQLFSLNVSNNTHLKELWCNGNQLSHIDISKNAKLLTFDCGANQLTSLDLSNNTSLELLNCYDNQLTNLNVSENVKLISLDFGNNLLTNIITTSNISLKELYCYKNQLISLDLSNNTSLVRLSCFINKLSSLDVSKNILLEYLDVSGISTLFKVCVWQMPFPPSGVTVDTTGSPNVYYTNECSR